MGTVVDRLASVLGDHHDVLDAGTSAARKYAPGSILNATPGRRAKQGSGAVIARADQRTGKRRIRTRSSVNDDRAHVDIGCDICQVGDQCAGLVLRAAIGLPKEDKAG